MAGIYVHIPFCKSRCIYCGFYSTTALDLRQRYADALCKEMVLRRDYTQGWTGFDTVYIGGGTPSLLTPRQLGQLFAQISSVYLQQPWAEAAPSMEITVECNPDDVTEDVAKALSQLCVNRVSMGVQTFNDERLQFLRRRHDAAQIPAAVKRLRDAGIDNISIDLMYGLPGETMADWQCDIDAALNLQVEHLSAYSLMFEENTLLYRKMEAEKADGMAAHGCYQPIDEDLERQMYETLIDRLAAAGYEHYEISNFARHNTSATVANPRTFRSRHNSSYWHDIPYVGLGAAAHSYDGSSRQWNVSDMSLYMTGIECGRPQFEREELDDDTLYNDRLTTALRTKDGLCIDSLDPQHAGYLMQQARKYEDQGLLERTGNNLRLTRRGLFVSDMIISDLMWV